MENNLPDKSYTSAMLKSIDWKPGNKMSFSSVEDWRVFKNDMGKRARALVEKFWWRMDFTQEKEEYENGSVFLRLGLPSR